jgi:hypothetical protein
MSSLNRRPAKVCCWNKLILVLIFSPAIPGTRELVKDIEAGPGRFARTGEVVREEEAS